MQTERLKEKEISYFQKKNKYFTITILLSDRGCPTFHSTVGLSDVSHCGAQHACCVVVHTAGAPEAQPGVNEHA